MHNFVAFDGTVYSLIFTSPLVGDMCTFLQKITVVFGGNNLNFPFVPVEFVLFTELWPSK